jgi:hypothetical protein
VHAGLIDDATGGAVYVDYKWSLPSYTWTTQNGVTTTSYWAYNWFRLY